MSEVWKRWEGFVANNRYTLRQFLGSTGHSAVFLTILAGPTPAKAVIKFISAEIPDASFQLAAWARAAQLTHPNLLRLYDSGSCRLEDMDLLYTVSEYAEENLGQFLPQRPLSAEEARDMLNPIVDALLFLHSNGLTHGHIKPSNILAIGDRLKLSGDTIVPIGEPRSTQRERDVYDAPETLNQPVLASGDVWSLAITLVEALTQQAPALPYSDEEDPAIPESLPQPYLEITRNALRRDPNHRWSCAQIAARLNPAAASAAVAGASVAAASAAANAPAASPAPPQPVASAVASTLASPLSATVSPLSVPLSREPAVPLAKLPQAPMQKPVSSPRPIPVDREGTGSSFTLPSYVLPVVLAAAVLLGAIFAVPRFFRHLPASPVSASAAPSSPSETPTPAAAPPVVQPVVPQAVPKIVPPVVETNSSSVESTSEKLLVSAVEKKQDTKPLDTVALDSAAAVPPAGSVANQNFPAASADNGEVLDQVLPQVSKKALSTIQGTVRVVVLAHVDPAGQVTSAELDSPGPSKYFANLSQQAATHWVFSTPQSGSRSAPSDWRIRFEFSQSGVHAFPQQV